MSETRSVHPCTRCGACCAHFRVSFYWREADDDTPLGVPVEMTEDASPFRRFMKGTGDRNHRRCIALDGKIGGKVGCSIYTRRPQPCRAFEPSFEDGKRNKRCDEARLAHGLKPLTPEDWR